MARTTHEKRHATRRDTRVAWVVIVPDVSIFGFLPVLFDSSDYSIGSCKAIMDTFHEAFPSFSRSWVVAKEYRDLASWIIGRVNLSLPPSLSALYGPVGSCMNLG
jgi:hypothetical protein